MFHRNHISHLQSYGDERGGGPGRSRACDLHAPRPPGVSLAAPSCGSLAAGTLEDVDKEESRGVATLVRSAGLFTRHHDTRQHGGGV